VGMSAYTVALLMVWWDVPFWVSTPLGIIVATIESFILGYFLFRLKGHYFAFVLVMGAILYMNWFRKSKLGFQLRAISSGEAVAESLGINIHWVKVKAYCITGIFAGAGGAFYTVYYNYIDPFSVMHLELSIMIALMTMIGGAGSMWGPIIGAMILIPLDRYLGAWLGGLGVTGVDFIIYALMVMIISAYEPKGIWGIIEKARARR